ncbi:MAG: hypothetical protein ACD_19C00014G0018 [uncultured bacterium]|nr:MAG: hypothetical protein ACD_19C00014G0018 [uncultured bacterium]
MTQNNLNKVVDAIKKILNPKKIILFGSYFRGENTKNSDIDLAVLQDRVNRFDSAKVKTYLYKSGYDWKVSPDIHLFSEHEFNERLKNNSLFIKEIAKGRIIYAV